MLVCFFCVNGLLLFRLKSLGMLSLCAEWFFSWSSVDGGRLSKRGSLVRPYKILKPPCNVQSDNVQSESTILRCVDHKSLAEHLIGDRWARAMQLDTRNLTETVHFWLVCSTKCMAHHLEQSLFLGVSCIFPSQRFFFCSSSYFIHSRRHYYASQWSQCFRQLFE